MLVTFADSHSALSVLDVDGMKVSSVGVTTWLQYEPDLTHVCCSLIMSSPLLRICHFFIPCTRD